MNGFPRTFAVIYLSDFQHTCQAMVQQIFKNKVSTFDGSEPFSATTQLSHIRMFHKGKIDVCRKEFN
jgi:hypothetical protein